MIALRFFFFALLAMSCFGGSVRAEEARTDATCVNARDIALRDPDNLQGVRTKWRSLSRDERNSIQPDLAGLTIPTWMEKLGDISVNAAELNLEPRRVLIKSPKITEDNWSAYISYVVNGGPAPNNVSEIEDTVIPNHQYTVSQRDRLLISFLQKIDDEYRAGKIQNTVGFLLHQRLWFRQGDGSRKKTRIAGA